MVEVEPMRGSLILLILAATMPAATARADFVITSMPPVQTAPPIVQTIPDKSPESASTRFKLAFGFGDRIPLSFAVRQIVPPAVKVTYGPGADRNAPVDWKGGQAWNRVLSEAVKPLGLRLVVSRMAVEIRK
jgi:hypothetical protein